MGHLAKLLETVGSTVFLTHMRIACCHLYCKCVRGRITFSVYLNKLDLERLKKTKNCPALFLIWLPEYLEAAAGLFFSL